MNYGTMLIKDIGAAAHAVSGNYSKNQVIDEIKTSGSRYGGTYMLRAEFISARLFLPADSIRTETEFKSLAERWKQETSKLSMVHKMAMHPAYQRIIGMGPKALPFIFRELATKGGHWLWALHAITREDPAQEGDDFDTAVQAWLSWGKKRGYI